MLRHFVLGVLPASKGAQVLQPPASACRQGLQSLRAALMQEAEGADITDSDREVRSHKCLCNSK